MYKVLIVDDEQHIRERVRRFFPWEELGFEVIATAKNGKDAYELIRLHYPHVVVSDILMPELTGIELAEQLNRSYPEVKLIMLSAYDDFEYAQKAIKYGVKGYLLKPLTKEDFLDTFGKLAEELNNEAELKKQTLHQSNWIQQELMVLNLVKGNVLSQTLKKEYRQFENSRVVIFPMNRLLIDTTYSLRQTVSEQTAKYWNRFSSPYAFYGNRIIVIINGEVIHNKKILYEILEGFFDVLRFSFQENQIEKGNLMAAVGNSVTSLSQIQTSYNEAIYAYSYKYFYEHSSIIFYDELTVNSKINKQNDDSADIAFLDDLENDLIESILTNEFSILMLKINDYFEQLKRVIGINVSEIQGACTELVIVILYRLKEKGYEFAIGGMQAVLEDIYSIESFYDLKSWLKSTLRTISEEIKTQGFISNQYVIQAKEYICKHYQGKITLAEMAETLFLHPTYFSTIFKNETGKNFVDYVNEIRVQKASELLGKGDYKIKQVAHLVGFQSESYFNRVFKKIKGISPMQYKRKFR